MSVVNSIVVYETAYTEVTFKPTSFLLIVMVNLRYQYQLENLVEFFFFSPSCEIPDFMDPYWNNWISPVKIRSTAPLAEREEKTLEYT